MVTFNSSSVAEIRLFTRLSLWWHPSDGVTRCGQQLPRVPPVTPLVPRINFSRPDDPNQQSFHRQLTFRFEPLHAPARLDIPCVLSNDPIVRERSGICDPSVKIVLGS